MAVKAVGAGDGRAQRLRHAQAVAKGGAAVTLFHACGLFGDVLFHQLRIALKAAVGDHHRACAPSAILCGNADTSAVFNHQRLRLCATHQHAAAFEQIGFQCAQQHVAAAAFPVQTRPAAARRRQHPFVIFGGTGTHEFDALALQPADDLCATIGHQPGEVILHKTIGGVEDQLVQKIRIERDLAQAQMKRAAGVARIAQVFFGAALFQYGGFKAQLRGTVGGDQAGDAAADDHQIDIRGFHITICF